MAGGPVVLVTGGSGFLGRVIVEQLLAGEVLAPREIRVFDKNVEDAPGSVTAIRGDVRDLGAITQACDGVDAVIHCAAVVDWGQHPPALVQAVNVGGTYNVIRACRESGVGSLMHISSVDAIYAGEPIVDGDETLPYPTRCMNEYCRTKTESERAAIAASGVGLRVAVVRPCSMYGPDDRFHIGSLVDMARRGPLLRIGDGSGRFQHVYVGNVAHMVLLATAALLGGRDDVAGEVFFATDHPAENFFDFFEPVLQACGLTMQPWSRALPARPVYALGVLSEMAVRAVQPVHRFTPMLTRFSVKFVTQEITFTSDKATKLLGYEPPYSLEEAMDITLDWYRRNG